MDEDTAVVENPVEQIDTESSSDDLRSQLTAAVKEVTERARDEAGRFAKAEKEPTAAAESAEAAPPKAAPQAAAAQVAQDAAAQAAAAAPAARAPDAWSPAAKAQFASLPPDIQAEITRREAEVHKGFTKQDEHRTLGKTFESAVAPYLPMIRAEGSDPIRAVGALMQTAYTLRAGSADQKEQALIGLMSQYQIDPNRVFQRLTGAQSQQRTDPQVAQLQQQLAQLQAERLEQRNQTEQAEQAQIAQTIESFASDPKNTYFVNVKAEMAALLDKGAAKDLQEAYDMACWARPDIRPLLLQQQEQQRVADAQARAAKARRAGSTLTGSPTGGTAGAIGAENLSLRDQLRSAYREVLSRE